MTTRTFNTIGSQEGDMVAESLLFENGRIYVEPGAERSATAVLVEHGEVTAIGDTAQDRARRDTRTIDLAGRTALPGFNDAHTHVLSVGLQILETDLAHSTSVADVQRKLAENADTTPPDEWIAGFGYDESTWTDGEKRLLTRADLDEVTREHPVAAQRIDGHTLTLNTQGLERIDFSGVESDVQTDENGTETGVVVESAVGRVRRELHPSGQKGREALAVAIERAHQLGLTSLQTMSGLTASPGQGDETLQTFADAWRANELPIRLTAWIHPKHLEALGDLELPGGFGDDRFRIAGVKRFADGSIGANTAKLHGEFADDPGNDGEMVMDSAELQRTGEAAAAAALPLATHAIGGAAIDAVIDNYEAIRENTDRSVVDRIEHVELATDAALARMADLGVVASMQPNFLQWSAPGGLYESRLGTDRLGEDNRFRDVLDAGIDLAFGSDKMPFGPLYGIHHAVNAPFETQRISVAEAIHAYTVGAARAEFAEERKGTLEPGKVADIVVLDRDPFDHPSELRHLTVDCTVLGGDIVYERTEES